MPRTPDDVKKLAKESGAKIVDLRFIDLPGMWQHFSIPVEDLDEDLFTEGIGFDGSSIRGFQQIHESDMLLIADAETAVMDPVLSVPTMNIICNVFDPMTRKPYSRDPRHVAQKAEAYLKSTGIADISYWGPEAEFYIFDRCPLRPERAERLLPHRLQRRRLEHGARGESEPRLQAAPQGGLLPGAALRPVPGYPLGDHPGPEGRGRARSRSTTTKWARPVRPRSTCASARSIKMADNLLYYKYIIRMICKKHGMTATFMPKPLFGDNGSGMHVHQSLWKGDTNVFYDAKGYALLSQTAKYYIGGLLKHAPALLAICAPTTNSYRRLVPGYEAPVNLVYSQRNRSAAVRIPVYSTSPKAKRIEFRCPDPSTNPYLCFAALLMAGLDGIKNKIDPGEPIDKDLYELEPEEAKKIKSTPGSLGEVLNALEKDHAFLLRG